jgi:hypothetical protein
MMSTLVAPAAGDIVDATPGGFTVKSTIDVAAAPTAVFLALVNQIGGWWDPEHTWSGNASNLSIDARAGGCFCEKLASGGRVQHMNVVWAERGKTLRMIGALGPLQELAVTGSMTWMLTDVSGRTKVEMTYTVGGYAKGGLEAIAKPVDAVLTTQVQRLKRFIETGKPSL